MDNGNEKENDFYNNLSLRGLVKNWKIKNAAKFKILNSNTQYVCSVHQFWTGWYFVSVLHHIAILNCLYSTLVVMREDWFPCLSPELARTSFAVLLVSSANDFTWFKRLWESSIGKHSTKSGLLAIAWIRQTTWRSESELQIGEIWRSCCFK